MGLRFAILILTALQAMIAAALGFADMFPTEWKIALIIASAGIAVVLNQLPTWQESPAAQARMRKSGAGD